MFTMGILGGYKFLLRLKYLIRTRVFIDPVRLNCSMYDSDLCKSENFLFIRWERIFVEKTATIYCKEVYMVSIVNRPLLLTLCYHYAILYSKISTFLAHRSRRLGWAIVIAHRPSVHPSGVNFSHFRLLL